MDQVYLGADVSKGYADFHFLGENGSLPLGRRWDDTPAGHAQVRQVITGLRADHPNLRLVCGVEASGGLERNWLRLFLSLAGPEDEVFQLNPLVVKRFRERHIHQNVTDRTSAADIADYLRDGRRAADRPYDPALQGARTLYCALSNQIKRSVAIQNELQGLLPVVHPDLVQYCRNDIPAWVLKLLARYPLASNLARARVTILAGIPYVTEARAATLIAAAKVSVASLTEPENALVIQSLVKELQQLEKSISKAKAVLGQQLKGDREVQRMLTIPGIGAGTAACLRLEAGSMKRFHSGNALVAFAGIDPLNHQSGDVDRPGGISHRGNSSIRAVLYMAVLACLRCNAPIREFYQRLRSRGKTHLAAATACMAKLLRIAYACVVKDQDFDPAKYEATRQKFLEEAKARHAHAAEAAAAAPTPAETIGLTAPVTRREAKKRRIAASVPQAAQRPQERGHAAAGTNDATQATRRPTVATATTPKGLPVPSNPG